MLGLEEVTVMVDDKDGHWMTVISKLMIGTGLITILLRR